MKVRKPGPKEERLNIDGDWEKAVANALKKPKDTEGAKRADKDKDALDS